MLFYHFLNLKETVQKKKKTINEISFFPLYSFILNFATVQTAKNVAVLVFSVFFLFLLFFFSDLCSLFFFFEGRFKKGKNKKKSFSVKEENFKKFSFFYFFLIFQAGAEVAKLWDQINKATTIVTSEPEASHVHFFFNWENKEGQNKILDSIPIALFSPPGEKVGDLKMNQAHVRKK